MASTGASAVGRGLRIRPTQRKCNRGPSCFCAISAAASATTPTVLLTLWLRKPGTVPAPVSKRTRRAASSRPRDSCIRTRIRQSAAAERVATELERLRARRRRHRGRLHRPGNAALRMPVLTRTQVSRIGVVRVAARRHEQGRDRFGSMFAEGFRHRTLGPSSVHRRRGSELRDWVMRSLWGLAQERLGAQRGVDAPR